MKRMISLILITLLIMGLGCACKSKKSGKKNAVCELTPADGEKIFYVSTGGDDTGDGSFQKPFATVEAARNAVRKLDKTGFKKITVAIEPGEYRMKSLTFSKEDSGSESCPISYGSFWEEPAIINGGITISPADFSAVSDETTRSRLSKEARDHVVCTDLTKLGLTEKDWGKLYAIGTYSTADHYDGDYVGDLYCELFINDSRMTMARYPNGDEWLYAGEVLQLGQTGELNHAVVDGWESLRNPKPDVYELDEDVAQRMKKWATLDDVWMFGYPGNDWADASSPIESFDADKLTITPKFVSRYEAKGYTPYYFYNVLEELDAPGEWYLDRKTGMLYLYEPENFDQATVDLSLTTEAVVTADEANDLTFENLIIKGTRGQGMNLVGDRNTVKNCTVKNVADLGIFMEGFNNTVTDCEICHTGKGGVELLGGYNDSLTPGNNICENCSIHNWAEIYQTYQAAVRLRGVANKCVHNDLYDAPHLAITWWGNNHIFEYNNIYNVCKQSDDAGAIYAGKSWICYGNIFRYNYIHDLGSDEHSPSGIYFDDGLSGNTVYGNILVNIPANGLFLGGGRDLDVRNNILVNCGYNAISYDQRAIDGFLGEGTGAWFVASRKEDTMWQQLKTSYCFNETWKKVFPQVQKFNLDYAAADDPNFPPNPANSVVTGNLILSDDGEIGMVNKKVYQYSKVEDNAIYLPEFAEDLFVDAANGDYTLKDGSFLFDNYPDFEKLPFHEMGRIQK